MARVRSGAIRAPVPAVLFLCVHNAGRSQMALGWFNHLADDRAVAWSGGSEPVSGINAGVLAAMAEVGIDISHEFSKPWTDEFVLAAEVVIMMGCGDACSLDCEPARLDVISAHLAAASADRPERRLRRGVRHVPFLEN